MKASSNGSYEESLAKIRAMAEGKARVARPPVRRAPGQWKWKLVEGKWRRV